MNKQLYWHPRTGSAMWLLYQLLYALAALVAAPLLLLRRGSHYLTSLRPRLGHVPNSPQPTLWLHAVSVGEVNIAASLASVLHPEQPLVVTTVTPSGQERAKSRFKDHLVTYLPFEFGFAVRRFFNRLKPSALILCEGDFWPLVLREARKRQVPVVVVNARISDRSFRRMQRLSRILAPIFEPITAFAVQTNLDADKLTSLGIGAERITVTGNLKFEIELPAELPALEKEIGSLAQGRPILVAGSTMRGEERQVVEAFGRLGGGNRALLVLAPRHPERWPRVLTELSRLGLSVQRRSAIGRLLERGESAKKRVDVLVLDSLGELAAIYGIGVGAYIGGTLVPTGGHNPLEAACHGVPIVAGPFMDNFREIEARFDDERAWQRVENAAGLADIWEQWLQEPDAACALGQRGSLVFESNKGALAKTRAFLEQHLAGVPTP